MSVVFTVKNVSLVLQSYQIPKHRYSLSLLAYRYLVMIGVFLVYVVFAVSTTCSFVPFMTALYFFALNNSMVS
jgi:hypothetical protein